MTLIASISSMTAEQLLNHINWLTADYYKLTAAGAAITILAAILAAIWFACALYYLFTK